VETPVPEGFFCGQGIGVVRHRGGRRDFFPGVLQRLAGVAEASSGKGRKSAKPGLSDEQIPVLIARDRNGETLDAILDAIDAEHLGAALKPVLGKDTPLCTDGSKAFEAMAKDAGIPHQAMNIKADIRVKERLFHIQNVNAYDSRLKGWMQRFKGVATRYLDSYLGWRWFYERHKENACNPKSWLIEAMGAVPGLEPTFNAIRAIKKRRGDTGPIPSNGSIDFAINPIWWTRCLDRVR
jgi:ISXO2-like transposase domain